MCRSPGVASHQGHCTKSFFGVFNLYLFCTPEGLPFSLRYSALLLILSGLQTFLLFTALLILVTDSLSIPVVIRCLVCMPTFPRIVYVMCMQPVLSNGPHSLLPAVTKVVADISCILPPLRDHVYITAPIFNVAFTILLPLLETTPRAFASSRAHSTRNHPTGAAAAANAPDGAVF